MDSLIVHLKAAERVRRTGFYSLFSQERHVSLSCTRLNRVCDDERAGKRGG